MGDSSADQFCVTMPKPLAAQIRKEAHDLRISVSKYIRLMHKHKDTEKVSKDSEIAEMGRALKEHRREQKAANLASFETKFQEFVDALPRKKLLKYKWFSPYHIRVELRQGYIDVWPSSWKYCHVFPEWKGGKPMGAYEYIRGNFLTHCDDKTPEPFDVFVAYLKANY